MGSSTVSALNKEPHFDVEPDQLNDFLNMLEEHVEEFGRIYDDIGGILNIPIDLENILERDFKIMVTSFGECTLQEICYWEETYSNGTSRGTQDTHMLYKYLLATMSKEGHATTTVQKSEYHIGNCPSGVLLLKVMICESHIDTNMTASLIRHQTANLKDYIIKVNCDIHVFNRHVQSLMEGLNSHGQQFTNLLVNLFAAYKAAKDKKFIEYIEDKESAHEEWADIMVPALLKYVSNKYKISMRRANGVHLLRKRNTFSPSMPRSPHSKNRSEKPRLRCHHPLPRRRKTSKEAPRSAPPPQVAC